MSNAVASTTERPATVGGKFLTFFLAGEEYGLEILKVQEIIGLLPITPVPRSARHFRGVVNLRGKVIPIVDLRRRFEMPEGTDDVVIIVVSVHGKQVGIAVDRVSEVLDIPTGEIEPAPELGSDVNTDFLLGLARAEGRVRLLLDIERVLRADEVVPAAA